MVGTFAGDPITYLDKHLSPLNEGRNHSYIVSFLRLVLFRDGSSVDVFGWNSSNVFANNALNSDFYAKYQQIEPEQAKRDTRISAGFALTRFLYAHGNVRSLVHCKI